MNFDHPKNRQTTNSDSNNNNQPLQNLNHRKCKKYFMVDAQTKVYFNADFDSGNLEKVEQISPYIYRLCPGYDKITNTTDKTFFHFKVFGFRMCTVRLHINRVHILQKLLRSGQQSSYRPVVKKGKGHYEPLNHGVKIYYNRSDQAQLSIEYQFEEEETWTYFAFSYPYPYQQMLSVTKQLQTKYANHSDIYFHNETLGYSQQGRKLVMITITQKMNCSKEKQEAVQGIFPQRQSKLCLKINKPKIIISGRVHPGETPSSFCIQGLLRFLLDEKDYRSYLLRKNFHFVIVPMLNPDGVYHGLFRNDLNGQNLNRVYVNCSKAKHPTIWSFKQYLKHLQSTEQQVMFYFDFHAHPSRKQFFIYGNAFNQFTHQVEAETFGKLLENNCPYFHNVDSIFTEKQMNSKDKYDVFTKQGCGRVYVHRLFNIIHSYTVQCGYFAPGKLQKWESVETILKRSQVLSKQYEYIGTWQKCSAKTYTIESYMLMGKSILCTVLDLFHLNPYTRINLNELRSISTIRKSVGIKVYNCVQRFRLIDANVTKKLKQLTKILQQEYYKIKIGQYGLSISQNYGMKHPKRTFSLLSRVYMSKNDLKIQLNSLDPQMYLNIEQINDEEEQGFEYQKINENLQHLSPQNEEDSNKFQNQIISHSQNFKQYKSQLEIKMPKNISIGNMKKLEQKYYSQIGHQCLHASKIYSGLLTQHSNRAENSQIEETSIFNMERNHKADQKVINSQIIKQVVLRRQKKSESQKSLNLLKMQKLNTKRKDTQQKLESNPYSWSLGKKNQKQLKISDIQKRLQIIAQIKASRLDSFLKKQSERKREQETSQVQKYVNLKIQQALKPQPLTSRFPSLYSKIPQKQKKKTIK